MDNIVSISPYQSHKPNLFFIGGGNKPRKPRKPRTSRKTRKANVVRFAKRYIPSMLSKADAKKAAREMMKSRAAYKKGKYYTRKSIGSFPHKKSKHIIKAEKMYGVDKMVPSKTLASKTGCSVNALDQLVKKGMGAYFSAGSRPSQTGHSWGYARMASAITGGKTAAVDWHILKNCKKTGKAYKLAKKAVAKHGRGTRKVPKRVVKLT